MAIKLNTDSVRAACAGSDRATVFGYAHCNYQGVQDFLSMHAAECGLVKAAAVAPWHIHASQNQIFKTELTNIVCENYLDNGHPPIKVLFCIDTNAVPLWRDLGGNSIAVEYIPSPTHFDPEAVTSKQAQVACYRDISCIGKDGTLYSAKPSLERANSLFTHKELRRAYKLCTDEALPEKFREVARRTFQFVRVEIQPEADAWVLELKPVPSPWESPRWDALWKQRKEQPRTSLPDPHPWRERVLEVISPRVRSKL